MGINSVSVVAPRAAPQEQKKERKSDMETILEGLQIANGILGIGTNIQSIRNSQGQIEAREQDMKVLDAKVSKDAEDAIAESRGLRTPAQLAELNKTHDLSDSPLAGAVELRRRDAQGRESPIYASVRQKAEAAKQPGTRAIETVEGGQVVTKIVEDKPGASFPAPPKAAPRETLDLSARERNTLQTQYDRDPSVRKNKEVLDSYDNARNLIKDPSPASDQALVFAYMKALDPGSVVRESEAESAQALGGLVERAKAKYDQISGEAGLTASQRADMVQQIEKLARAADERQTAVDKQFVDLASRRNVAREDLRFVNRPTFEQMVAAKQQGGSGTAIAAPQGQQPPTTPATAHPQAGAAKVWAEQNASSPDPEIRAKAAAILNALSAEPADAPASKATPNPLGNRYRGNRG